MALKLMINGVEHEELTAAQAMRHELFNKLTPLMLGSAEVSDAQLREMLQSCCHDMVRTIECLIGRFRLEEVHAPAADNLEKLAA
jgi:hypothetical protein